MPNWCVNEIRFNLSDSSYGNAMMEGILDFVKETIPNFNRRIRIAEEAEAAALEKRKTAMPFFRQSSALQRDILDFNSIIPYPEEFKRRDEDAVRLSREEMMEKYGVTDPKAVLDGYNNGGYEWCIKNWGSKWNASDVAWVPERKMFIFDTAWSPVFPIVSAIHKRFPEVHIDFEYHERGMCVVGGCEYIPYRDWDPADYETDKVHDIEQSMKKEGKPPEPKWEAGKAYNPWSSEYMGFKGG